MGWVLILKDFKIVDSFHRKKDILKKFPSGDIIIKCKYFSLAK